MLLHIPLARVFHIKFVHLWPSIRTIQVQRDSLTERQQYVWFKQY